MIWPIRQFCFLIDQIEIVVTQTTQDFVGNWTNGEDSFQVDPPNAALVVLTENQEDDVFEIELFNPIYDEDEKAIRYDFRVLGNPLIFLQIWENQY